MRKSILFFFLLFTACVHGQLPDTSVFTPGVSRGSAGSPADSLVSIYYLYQPDSLALFNGRQFYGYSSLIQGHAFFKSDDWTRGNVLYDGLWYHNKKLMYDIYTDELIVEHPGGLPLLLFSGRVRLFTLGDDTFVNLARDKDGIIKNGFYQLLVKGSATVLVKRAKFLDEKTEGMQVERKFLSRDQFFILKDSRFYPVEKQQDLMTVLRDRREVHSFRNSLGLRFKSNKEEVILRVTRYYNQLHP